MKFFIASGLLAMSLTTLAAATNPQDCLKQKKALDRRYCMDSYLETVKENYDAERGTFAGGINDKSRAEKVAAAAPVKAQAKKKKKKDKGFRIKL